MVLIGMKVSCDGVIYEAPKQSPANGGTVSNLVLAVDNGDSRDFVDLAFWGKDAESIMKYPVGHHISIDCGKLAAGAYNDKDGKPRVRLKIIVSSWHSLEALEKNDNSAEPERKTQEQKNINKLKESLNYTLKSGKYSGEKVSDILIKDARYIYNLCVDDRVNASLKQILCSAYQYWYEKNKAKQTAK